MIKTLRITSVAAVLFAAVVLASVLGFRRPIAFLHLNLGTGGNTQVEKILSGPSAMDRFKGRGGKPADGPDTTSPLVKEATVLESIINPREEAGAKPVLRGSPVPKPIPVSRPPIASAKFELLGLYYSPDVKTSLALIRTPEGAYQWVGPGSEIGHATIKEIRQNSIVYADGGRDVEMPVVAPPETANLLEASDTAVTPEPSLPRPTVGAKATGSPLKPAAAASPKAVAATTVPPAHISKEEQESLSQFGDRLKSVATADPLDREALNNKLISEYKAAQANPTEANKVESPGEAATAETDTSKAAVSEESRRQFLKKLSRPRTSMK